MDVASLLDWYTACPSRQMVHWLMAALAYPVALTWTWLGFSPGEGLCNQMPFTEPFWLLYPDPEPPHTEALPLGDPPPETGPVPPVVVEVEPPHPAMTNTWSANANEQRKKRKRLDMMHSRHAT